MLDAIRCLSHPSLSLHPQRKRRRDSSRNMALGKTDVASSSIMQQHATKISTLDPSTGAATAVDVIASSDNTGNVDGATTEAANVRRRRRRRQGPLVDARQLTDLEQKTRFPGADFNVPTTLSGALRVFFSHPSIQLILSGKLLLLWCSTPLTTPSYIIMMTTCPS